MSKAHHRYFRDWVIILQLPVRHVIKLSELNR